MRVPGFGRSISTRDLEARCEAISRSQAVIEFSLDGIILTANDNFLSAMGYRLEEIAGKHHSMFCDPAYAASEDYKNFWADLRRGSYQSAAYQRFAKGGREVWIQASYNPVLDRSGKPIKVIKFATDITEQVTTAADHKAQVAAISRAQAVIAFNLDGTVIEANQNFLATLGYRLEEIVGRHHSMFCEAGFAASPEYKAFWRRLGDGEYVSAEFQRFGKGGKPIWIQASYNPIFNAAGKVVKVVKFATDISERKRAEGVIALLTESLAGLARGFLGGGVDTAFTGPYEELRQAFNQSLTQLEVIVGGLRNASYSLKIATAEILTGANDLSQRTTRQAATIEETSAAVEQLASTVSDNARRAATASDKARNLAQDATKGGTVMTEATQAMAAIETSSAKISNIIGMIDDIAFQTNLLALNASVEAARAGDAGKGFAVVAVEVRRLAQSAAQASSDVKALIETSAGEVRTGAQLVEQAARKLGDILHGAEDSFGLIDDMAKASREQSSALNEVAIAIRQMDEMTQHNAALVEETNAAIEQTETQAAKLDGIVDVFRHEGKGPRRELSAA
jgi:methyl-accepting chemotaxis protein